MWTVPFKHQITLCMTWHNLTGYFLYNSYEKVIKYLLNCWIIARIQQIIHKWPLSFELWAESQRDQDQGARSLIHKSDSSQADISTAQVPT